LIIEQTLGDNLRERNKLNTLIDNLRSELAVIKKEKIELTVGRDVNESKVASFEKESLLSRNNIEKMSKELDETKMESSKNFDYFIIII
jgi:predicted  nucleic acid-binding Zn ribbon protein